MNVSFERVEAIGRGRAGLESETEPFQGSGSFTL
jgi:hypothetical protein